MCTHHCRRCHVLQPGDSSSATDCCCWAAAQDWPHRGCCSYCRLCSSSNSCPMKFRFGDMIGRAALTILYASTMDTFRWRITYAMAMVGDREMPAWQCISTLPPDFRAPSAWTEKKNEKRGEIESRVEKTRKKKYQKPRFRTHALVGGWGVGGTRGTVSSDDVPAIGWKTRRQGRKTDIYARYLYCVCIRRTIRLYQRKRVGRATGPPRATSKQQRHRHVRQHTI